CSVSLLFYYKIILTDSKRDENVQLFKLKVLYYCARDENNLLLQQQQKSSLTTKPFPPLN
ncbi:MAG: hypothetical protein ACI8RD_008685, partial [Bacillariaceae sp.]